MPWRERPHDDFDAEIRAHIEAEEAALIAEGVSPEAAAIQARKAFGNVLLSRELFYEKRRFRMLSTFFSDLRQGMRQLRLNPGFAVLAITTMAIAIGATTALFSVVYAVLLKPLPYADPDRLARVWMDNRRLQMREDWASWANYQDYKSMGTSLESMVAFATAGANIVGDGEPERLDGLRAEGSTALQRLHDRAPGARIELTAFRRDELYSASIVAGEPSADTAQVREKAPMPPEAKALLDRWL